MSRLTFRFSDKRSQNVTYESSTREITCHIFLYLELTVSKRKSMVWQEFRNGEQECRTIFARWSG